MMTTRHDAAQELAVRAALALAEGQRQTAVALYADAAALEKAALAEAPLDKPRTRSILAVSSVALLYKAQLYEQAEEAIYRFLGDPQVNAASKKELKELLESVWDDALVASMGASYSGEEIEVALRGGAAGFGTAPLDTALQYMSGITNFIFRVSELQIGAPLRTSGGPSRDIVEAVQARATQPAPGSYRFAIKLVEPAQHKLFAGDRELKAREVASNTMRILRAAISEDGALLAEAVPDAKYRLPLAKLIRNFLPTSHELREVEVTSVGVQGSSKVLLIPAVRPSIAKHIRELSPKDRKQPEAIVRGVLRALHLDERWLEITAPDGSHEHLGTRPDELDDVLGPMVNKFVVAHVAPGRKRKRIVLDIELGDETHPME